MPLPATRNALPHVGAARDARSGAAARAHAQVGGLLRCGPSRHGSLRLGHVRSLQCTNLRYLPAPALATPPPRQAPGRRAGQRQVPPRALTGASAASIPSWPELTAPDALQPTACTDRAGLEARAPSGPAQPLLRYARLRPRRRQPLFRQLVATQQSAASTMLHYLSRCVY